MIISIVNTKGGVGKTTTSMMLARAAFKAGYSAQVWDADPQGSATGWALAVQDNGENLGFEVVTVAAPQLKRLANGKTAPDVDVLVIDTPPGGAQTLQLAIDSADLVIIPTLPSAMDMQRVWPTLEAASHRRRAVLINSAEVRTNALSAVREVLDAQGEPVFTTMIPKRQSIRALYGGVPDELFNYDKLFEEILEVTQ